MSRQAALQALLDQPAPDWTNLTSVRAFVEARASLFTAVTRDDAPLSPTDTALLEQAAAQTQSLQAAAQTRQARVAEELRRCHEVRTRPREAQNAAPGHLITRLG